MLLGIGTIWAMRASWWDSNKNKWKTFSIWTLDQATGNMSSSPTVPLINCVT